MKLEQIRRLKIETTSSGIDDAKRKLSDLNREQDNTEKAARRTERAENALSEAMRKQQALIDGSNQEWRERQRMMQQYQQMADANVRAQEAIAKAANDNARSTNLAGDAARYAAKSGLDYAASVAVTSAKVTAGILLASAAATVLGGLYLAYKVLTTVVGLVTDAWELGNKQLADFVELGKKATLVSSEFYQRMQQAAMQAKVPVDALLASIERLNNAAQSKLGGSDLNNLLNQHLRGGNLAGVNTQNVVGANNAEERYRAIVGLLDEMMSKGRQLAAMDIAGKVFGPEAVENLRKNSDYYKDIVVSADKIKATQLISDAEIGRATDLNNRYDAAVKILGDRWHPLQSALTELGVQMKTAWVNILEAVAGTWTFINKIVDKVITLPGEFWQWAKRGFATVTGTGEQFGPKYTDPREFALGQLRDQMKNPANLMRGRDEVDAVQAAVWKDTSKAITETAKALSDVGQKYETAVNQVDKHIARMEADARSVGLGTAALERNRTEATLYAAAQAAGLPVTEALTKAIEAQAERAGKAAEALAKARIQNQIDFDRKTLTMGLSQEDIQIAQSLTQIYGSNIPAALNSTEAAQMRVNNAMKEANQNAAQFADTLLQGLMRGEGLMRSLSSAASSLGQRLASQGLQRLMNNNLTNTGSVSASQGALGVVGAAAGGYQSGSPLTGALSGALAGTAILPGIGTAIGAIVGGIGGMFGSASQARRQEQQRRMEELQRSFDAEERGWQLPAKRSRKASSTFTLAIVA